MRRYQIIYETCIDFPIFKIWEVFCCRKYLEICLCDWKSGFKKLLISGLLNLIWSSVLITLNFKSINLVFCFLWFGTVFFDIMYAIRGVEKEN